MDALVVRRTAMELAGLTRVLLGTVAHVPATAPGPQLSDLPATELLDAASSRRDIPPLTAVPNPVGHTPEPPTHWRPARPSLELLQEIAFLEE